MMYKIELDEKSLELVGKALAALPYGQVVGLLGDLQDQIKAQEGNHVSMANDGEENDLSDKQKPKS